MQDKRLFMGEHEQKANDIFEKYERDLTQVKSSSLLARQEVNREVNKHIRDRNIPQVEYWQKVRSFTQKL